MECEEDSREKRTIKMGKLTMIAPKDWVRKDPKFRIIAHEFAAPAAKEDKAGGRMTVMSSGGTIEMNIARWYGQRWPWLATSCSSR